MSAAKKTKIKDSLKRLDELVKYFEQDSAELDLDQDLEKYEESMRLITDIRKELESFELRMSEIKNKYAPEGNEEVGQFI